MRKKLASVILGVLLLAISIVGPTPPSLHASAISLGVRSPVHLTFTLYDEVDTSGRHERWTDQDASYVDFNLRNWADKAARIKVERGDAYVVGDHVLLLDETKPDGGTDTVAVDPAVAADVDLHRVNFDDKAAAAKFVYNRYRNGQWRLRVQLFDTVPQVYPSLIIYDWEGDMNVPIDLNPFHFADKAAKARVDRGPAYKDCDQVDLLDAVRQPTLTQTLETGTTNLHRWNWDDKAAAIMFRSR